MARIATIDQKWLDLFKLIPGYDPVASAAPGEWFDPAAAQRAIDFFPACLKHGKGKFAGQPFHLSPWQKAIVACLFGWKRADGTRRYRECLLYVGRGNGKTPLAAGIALYLLFCDDEVGCEGYIVAAATEQAAIMFGYLSGFVEAEPEFVKWGAKLYRAKGSRSIINTRDAGAVCRILSSDGALAHGLMPAFMFGDELHEWQGSDMTGAIETSFAKSGRRQPLLLWMTTADYDRPSACNEKLAKARMVRDGAVQNSSFLPAIWENKPDADWTDEKTWEAANPNIDVTVDRAKLREMVADALLQPSKQNDFKRFHLNMVTTSQSVYIPLEKWDKCRGEVDFEALKGDPCFGGLDMSLRQDLTAFALVWPPHMAREKYAVAVWFWLPADTIQEHERTDNVPYQLWIDDGWVALAGDYTIDEGVVERFIQKKYESGYNIVEIGFDGANAMGLGERLGQFGLTMTKVPQTIMPMTAGTKALDDMTAEGKILHNGNPTLRWNLGCTQVRGDANQNLRPVKPDRATGKRIDGVVALIMALGRAVNVPPVTCAYDTRGIVYV